MVSRSVPTFELYGEMIAGNYTDPIHHEPIHERSREHNWKIRAHRHSSLSQVFIFRTPNVDVQIGEMNYVSKEPILLVIPPNIPHGFRFSEDVEGEVISLRINEIDPDTKDRIQGFTSGFSCILPQSESRHFTAVDRLTRELGDIYHNIVPERSALISSIMQLIVTYLSADLDQQALNSVAAIAHPSTRQEAQIEKFCKLIERRFASNWTVGKYAEEVGVSTPHLTRICKQILGFPPNEVVRQRRILEAKRLLEYTNLTIAEVAFRSGFREAAFFSRSFKTIVGIGPKDFRLSVDR